LSKITEQRRQEILHAAFEEFRSKGLREASVADIARRADIGKSTIYEYYPSKEELVREVGSWVLRQFSEELRSSFSDDMTLTEQLCSYLDSFFKMPPTPNFRDSRKAMEDMVQLMQIVGTESLRQEYQSFRQETCDIIAQALSRASERGEISMPEDPHIAAEMVIALLNPFSISQLRQTGLENAAKRAVQTVLAGLTPHRKANVQEDKK